MTSEVSSLGDNAGFEDSEMSEAEETAVKDGDSDDDSMEDASEEDKEEDSAFQSKQSTRRKDFDDLASDGRKVRADSIAAQEYEAKMKQLEKEKEEMAADLEAKYAEVEKKLLQCMEVMMGGADQPKTKMEDQGPGAGKTTTTGGESPQIGVPLPAPRPAINEPPGL